MRLLEERILKDGVVLPGEILKVGSFLNHNIDVSLLKEMAKEVKRLFPCKVDKVLTIEASGIAFGTMVAFEYECDLLFAKKKASSNLSGEVVTAKVYSYTHHEENTISIPKDYIKEGDNVLIVDDFLAKGNALRGLVELVRKCNAHVIGCCVEIEKVFQNGGNDLRREGIKVEALAGITKMTDTSIMF